MDKISSIQTGESLFELRDTGHGPGAGTTNHIMRKVAQTGTTPSKSTPEEQPSVMDQ